MFPKKSQYYNLVNNLTKDIIEVYYFEWCSLHTIESNQFNWIQIGLYYSI